MDGSMVRNRDTNACMGGELMHLCMAARFTLSAVFIYPSCWAGWNVETSETAGFAALEL